MAALVHQSHPPRHELDSKYLAGGAFDLDFICQYLVLVWAPTERSLAAVPESSRALIAALEQVGALSWAQSAALQAAGEFYQSLQLMLRLTVGGDQNPVVASLSLANLFVGLELVSLAEGEACETATVFARLGSQLTHHCRAVEQVWAEVFSPTEPVPAGAP